MLVILSNLNPIPKTNFIGSKRDSGNPKSKPNKHWMITGVVFRDARIGTIKINFLKVNPKKLKKKKRIKSIFYVFFEINVISSVYFFKSQSSHLYKFNTCLFIMSMWHRIIPIFAKKKKKYVTSY